MSQAMYDKIRQVLATNADPVSLQNLVDVVEIRNVAENGDTLSAELCFGYAIEPVREQLQATLSQLLTGLGFAKLKLTLTWQVKPAQDKPLEGAGKVKNILAVASGKGGVGKSTTAVNLALALAADGARVGILDADIYGPSLGMMLGVPKGTRPEVHQQNFFVPIESLGLQSISMGFLTTEETPMVWRGPMASGALQQLLKQTLWNDLDYLVVDMPPGTGDIQLTLSQQVPVSGAVVVTTPQDIALLDAKKGIEMFRKVHVAVLGVVENMATHICSQCGHEEHIFGEGGGAAIAKEYGVSVLGSLPLDLSIREQADSGKPTVASDPNGPIAAVYRQIARLSAGQLAKMAGRSAGASPKISIHND
ncbi:iron-sulfur cluster carrier protein ApbC [Ketobacter sp. MCCC 1A13808]|uniref:iron-sulfur cluster carrier protein ApbC n=1 Tax=Ketobacter sp. MCCC 1A13808 TaxID=2602738 RepID=UPI000F27A548|nr:iron-sulfur cluster carrier protein ApbC [Ketobacter sp. MCCC 1A13808]MVF10794.1 iron-sulfur cluster carrier protein ApbC [Ketobacter sp. MCCC 1A13808]RLP56207.1 MAG: iron-sulfur cluster carrier protein ApbC [Ketobacter sp.]